MKLLPLYAENIIVGTKNNGIFNWYVTDKELWFLDFCKLVKAYSEKGFSGFEAIDENERSGIDVLDENSATHFLKKIEMYKVKELELNGLMREKVADLNDTDDLLDYAPALYVDFDKRELSSMYPEPASYEEYAPSNWIGRFRDFTNDIDLPNKYWIDESGKSLFQLGSKA